MFHLFGVQLMLLCALGIGIAVVAVSITALLFELHEAKKAAEREGMSSGGQPKAAPLEIVVQKEKTEKAAASTPEGHQPKWVKLNKRHENLKSGNSH